MRKTQTSSTVRMRYRQKAYEAINFDVPRGRKAELDAHLKAKGMTVSGFLNQCIREELGIPAEEWKTYRPQKPVKVKKQADPAPENAGGEDQEQKNRNVSKETWLMRD